MEPSYKGGRVSLVPLKDAPQHLVKPSWHAWECWFHPGKVIRRRATCQKCDLDEITRLSQKLEGGYR